LNTLEGHTCSTNMISWDPSGVYLASSGNDGSIRVWDVANGNNISIYGASGSDGEAEPFEGITWNPGSSQIATFQGRAILILDPFTSQLIKRVTDAQDRSRITTIAWDPSGDLLAAGTLSDQIKIWNVATGNLDQPLLSFGTTPVSSIAWSPDGSRIVTGGVDGILRVFDAASGQMLASFPGNTQSAPSIAWSDDGSRIASASWDNAVRVWDAESGYQLDVFSNSTSVYAVAWSPDGITLAYGGARDVTVTIVTPSVAIPTPTPTHSPTPIPSAIGSIISEVGAIMLVLLQQPGRIMR
jgi:WD40 repeat protein